MAPFLAHARSAAGIAGVDRFRRSHRRQFAPSRRRDGEGVGQSSSSATRRQLGHLSRRAAVVVRAATAHDHRGSRHGRPGEECGLGIEGLRRAQLIAWHVHHMRISLECDCSDEEPHARPFLVHRRAVVPGRARGHAGKANRSQSQVFGAVARTDQATTTATVNESPPVAALRLGQVTCAP